MPDFLLPDPSGKTAKRSEVTRDNKIVVVNFWASWCCPQPRGNAELGKLSNAQKSKDFTNLAIIEDKNVPSWMHILNKNRRVFLSSRPGRRWPNSLKIESLPTTVLMGESRRFGKCAKACHRSGIFHAVWNI
jgi:thiol-disulfide isomerase/thioredoxin